MIFDIRFQQLPLVSDGVTLHTVSVLPGQAAVQRGGQWSLLHKPLLSVNCPQPLSRLCVGADQFQQQCLRCLLAKEIPGDGDRGRNLHSVCHVRVLLEKAVSQYMTQGGKLLLRV